MELCVWAGQDRAGQDRTGQKLYQIKIKSDATDDFEMAIQVVNAVKAVLTHLPNPIIADQKSINPRIKRLSFSEKIADQDMLLANLRGFRNSDGTAT